MVIGTPPSWNLVVAIAVTLFSPPMYSGFLRNEPTASATARTCGSLNGISWLTHWSYTSGPLIRSMKSSNQSVTGHPVATPDSMPAHHGVPPSATIWSDSAVSSSSVSGTS